MCYKNPNLISLIMSDFGQPNSTQPIVNPSLLKSKLPFQISNRGRETTIIKIKSINSYNLGMHSSMNKCP